MITVGGGGLATSGAWGWGDNPVAASGACGWSAGGSAMLCSITTLKTKLKSLF